MTGVWGAQLIDRGLGRHNNICSIANNRSNNSNRNCIRSRQRWQRRGERASVGRLVFLHYDDAGHTGHRGGCVECAADFQRGLLFCAALCRLLLCLIPTLFSAYCLGFSCANCWNGTSPSDSVPTSYCVAVFRSGHWQLPLVSHSARAAQPSSVFCLHLLVLLRRATS